MAKKQEYICPYCKNKVSKEESIQEGKRYFHSECLERKTEEEKEQRKHADDYKSLIEYICTIYKLDAPTGMILKQVKDFQVEYSYKLKGIELALRYFYETLENKVQDGTGIGIVPYVYEEAKKHYLARLNVEESLKEIEQTTEKNVVVIQSPQFSYQRKVRQIDISSL